MKGHGVHQTRDHFFVIVLLSKGDEREVRISASDKRAESALVDRIVLVKSGSVDQLYHQYRYRSLPTGD